jgi:hypothetical protein
VAGPIAHVRCLTSQRTIACGRRAAKQWTHLRESGDEEGWEPWLMWKASGERQLSVDGVACRTALPDRLEGGRDWGVRNY